ncbi:hypothetical protein BDY19DRAFT_1048911 [Irpex rosettiformis]|uniref:Uncharacterized protein n=1 Tax=Irpex rosettiformis TaxID=378272 RepID=A0ACB8U0Y6_9APHY|nr:hypothetical protein BDY19DRAFT_1048911 [Irpex rosettiformis]
MPRPKRSGTVGGLDAPWNQEQRTPTADSILSRGSVKRHKTDGMNSRFDRMIATVNIMPTPDSRKKRCRASSSASGSSLMSYDVPKTPVDAYNDLEGGRLGEDFTVIKMKQHHEGKTSRVPSTFDLAIFESLPEEKEDVPGWLSDAMSNIGAHHPIRALIPSTKADISTLIETGPSFASLEPAPYPLPETNTLVLDDNPFAFRAPSRGHHGLDDPVCANPENEFRSAYIALQDGGQELQILEEESFHESPNSPPRPPSSYARSTSEAFLGQSLSSSLPSNLLPCASGLLSPLSKPQNTARAPACNANLTSDPPSVDLAPFSTPGPFVTNAAPKPTNTVLEPSSTLRASSVLYGPSVSSAIIASDFMSASAALPFSTPGPLVRKSLPAFSNSKYCSVSNTCLPESPRHSMLPDYSIEPLENEHTSSSSDLPVYLPPETPDNAHQQPPRSNPLSFSTSIQKHVYFDCPAEDPVGSDPLDPDEYELDLDYDCLESLDFRWEKFDPSGAMMQERSTSGVKQYVAASDDEDSCENDAGGSEEAPTSQQLGMLDLQHVPQASYTPDQTQTTADVDGELPVVAFTPHDAFEAPLGVSSETETSTREESSKQGPYFAPAPGIFISPLRGDGSSEAGNPLVHKDIRDMNPSMTSNEVAIENKPYNLQVHRSLPRTPVNQIISLIPKTPNASRNGRAPTPPSIPKIAVLCPEEISEDEINDLDGELCSQVHGRASQDSHDTIESWSGI